MLNKAIGENLYCVFVNNGLLRKDEFSSVLKQYEGMGLNVKGVDASQQFYDELKGLSDPEAKRKAIGKVFIDVFDQEANLIEDVKWLAQGTIYPDVIESVSADGGTSATIKSHHNVGGLPDFMKLKVVEPLKALFKDEVRVLDRYYRPELYDEEYPLIRRYKYGVPLQQYQLAKKGKPFREEAVLFFNWKSIKPIEKQLKIKAIYSADKKQCVTIITQGKMRYFINGKHKAINLVLNVLLMTVSFF